MDSPPQTKDNPSFLDKSHESRPVKRICLSVSKLKVFLVTLAFSYFAKGLSGMYMKSMTTQIERRFEISSLVVGLIDGSFEIGNLMVMLLVSYLGPKIHRPKVIGIGCIIMAVGTFTSAVPHFVMGRYDYENIAGSLGNSSNTSTSACSASSSHHVTEDKGNATTLACEKMSGSYLWIFVLVGNLLRGIGEAPIMPLGMSYIDDFAREENSAFYIGTVRSFGMLGPTLGFLLGAFCANLWVDIGFVNVDTLKINPKDIRWVGAWWLGLLICGAVCLVASLPFCFLPHSLPKEGDSEKKPTEVFAITKEIHCKMESPGKPQLQVSEAVKEFFPTLKKLFGNSVYPVFLLLTILQYNALVGLITFESKFMEQQFSIPVSKAIFFIGIVLLPVTVVGMFLGGLLIKKFKLHITGMAKVACATFLVTYFLNLLYFLTSCEVLDVAGLTVNYSGIKEPSYSQETLLSACNSDCNCEGNRWDPVCGDNGLTYMTPCLAGCKASVGSGKEMVFHNCSCVAASGPGNLSAVLGQCPREKCTEMFPYFLALLTICSFLGFFGATPTYMIMFRSVSPDLKSFAVGIETLGGRILGGLPAPMYFGALIDSTCLKWGTNPCGGRGFCRLYDTQAFRTIYLGLIAALRAGCCLLYIVLLILIMKQFRQVNREMFTPNTKVPSQKAPGSSQKKLEPLSMETAGKEDTHL